MRKIDICPITVHIALIRTADLNFLYQFYIRQSVGELIFKKNGNRYYCGLVIINIYMTAA